MKIDALNLFLAKLIWPRLNIEETNGYTRHCVPGAPWAEGVRFGITDASGAAVDCEDAASHRALTPKLLERLRVKLIALKLRGHDVGLGFYER